MNRSVQVYINGERLELFQDEQIVVNSSQQNINDISKVFTDFSQSFTVPASPTNNAIFSHFYENKTDGTFDFRIRQSAVLKIDHQEFRTGKIQLENATIEDNRPVNYQITFYGEIRTLKDLFSEDKLNVLDYSAYEHDYTGAEVKNRINNLSSRAIRYPLVTSLDVWSYGDGTSTDITTSTGRIDYRDLFPAIQIKNIFTEIENHYGITFEGAFLSDPKFLNMYLWLKNKEQLSLLTENVKVDISTTTSATYFNTTNDTLNYTYRDLGATNFSRSHKIDIQVINISDPALTYYIDCYKNGELQFTLTGTNNQTFVDVSVENNILGLNSTWEFYIRGENQFTANVQIFYTYSYTQLLGSPPSPESFTDVYTGGGSTQTLAKLNIKNNVPDMTVAEFFSGILKVFNLTCYPIDSTTFQVEPLDDWYSKGALVDITPHVDAKSISIERYKLYSKVAFENQKSESWINRTFTDLFNREYGDRSFVYEFDGPEYKITTPFEHLLFQRFTGTDLAVGYSVTKYPDFKPYIPKPTLIYLDNTKSCSFKYYNGSTEETITSYAHMGSTSQINGIHYTNNWGAEVGVLSGETETRSLYREYYEGYLQNLFSQKQRVTKLKGILPTSLLVGLRLNDRLIIRDKRYIISDIKTNITTGEVDLTLIYDLRDVINPNSTVNNEADCIEYRVKLPRISVDKSNKGTVAIFKVVSATLSSTTPGVTITPSTVLKDQVVTICYNASSTPKYTRITEEGEIRIAEGSAASDFDGYQRVNEENAVQFIDITQTNTYENGDVINVENYVIQLP